tara:strand:- start:5162 stop:6571 length:1410 start_codon:yes stop_codon:yes gene_type:complete
MIQKNLLKIEIIIIFFSVILSFFFAVSDLKRYDKIKINFDNNSYNQLLYEDLGYTWQIADKFRKKLKSGKNFIESLPNYQHYFLPSIIVGYYYYLIDKDIFVEQLNNRDVIKVKNSKLPLLIFQIIIYYLSVFIFSTELKKKVKLPIYLSIFIFLTLEPSIFQWHHSFWSESIFLSLMLIIFYMLLKVKKEIFFNLLLGILISTLYLQRSVSFLYIIPVLIYLSLIFKTNIKPLLFTILGSFLIFFLIGFNNFKKTDRFYILSLEHQYYSYYHYFAGYIKADRKNIEISKAEEELQIAESNWMTANKIDLDHAEDYLKAIDFRNKSFLNEVIQNPLFTIKFFTKKVIMMCIIHPTWVEQSYKTDKSDPEARNNPKKYYHKNLKRNILYSIFLYFFILIGFISWIKNILKYKSLDNFDKFIIFNILSILYFVLISGFWGNPKYFTPCTLSLSLFFGYGINVILQKFKIVK